MHTNLENADYSAHVDFESISVVGYALGGTAVLALAGGKFNAPTFIQSCTESVLNTPDCAWYNAQNVSLDSVDQVQLIASRRDPRVRLAVAINPEYVTVFSNESNSIEAQTMLITLGSDERKGSAIRAKSVTLSNITDANLFDGFGQCTPAGPTILTDDAGDTALCGSSTEARVHAHNEILEQIESLFKSTGGQGG